MEGAHIIEVNDLVISMTSKQKLGCLGVNEKQTENALFNKIKRRSCDVDKDSYEPSVVSIGPCHHRTQATLEMERTKWESFRYILRLNPEKKLRDYLDAIAELEPKIRSCYANDVKTGTDKLLTMILVDGCFLLYILGGIEGASESVPNFNMLNTDERNIILAQCVNGPTISTRVYSREQTNSNNMENDDSLDNTSYSEHWYTSFLTHDLVLLENQIPFFIVVKIFELVTDGNSPVTVLLQNVSRFMEDLLHSYPKAILKFNQPEELRHLLHLCHLYFKPNNQKHVRSSPNLSTLDDEVWSRTAVQQLLGWHQATEYQKAGIEFKKREFCIENPHSLLDIRFCKGVLEMPCLTIDTNTYSLFRNLLAFEETCPLFGNYITTYVVFLSQFIKMPDDVALLTKRGIVVHQLDSDDELSELFRMLAEGVSFDFNRSYYLKDLFHVMEVHYQDRRPQWRQFLGSIGSKFSSWARESKPNEFTGRASPEQLV